MAILYPRTRKIVSIVLGIAFLAFVAQLQLNDRRGPAPISVETVVLSDISYATDPRLTQVTGRVENTHPELILSQLELRARAFDCPTADSARDTCTVIGETTVQVAHDVPPGQARGISTPLRFPNPPALNGVQVFGLELLSARGR
jgi:hypothetical protein